MKVNLKEKLAWLVLILLMYCVLFMVIQTGIMGIYHVQILMGIGISILMALGTNLVLGFSGQFSLGQSGFMAIGAYATAIITRSMPTYFGFYFSMGIGIIIAGLIALVVGIPTLRLKGDYLAIATLGVSEIIRIMINNGGTLTNGASGLSGVLKYTTWTVVFLFVVLITILVANYLNSPLGRSVIAVREDDIAAESMGINATKMKVITFVFAAMISAVAGSLYVGYIGSITPRDFTILRSIDYLIIVVLGGLGSITGTIVSAIFLGVLNMYLQGISNVRMIVYSLALILVMVYRPGGLLGTKELYLSKWFNTKRKEVN